MSVDNSIRFGTLSVKPILVRVMTSDAAESPEDFANGEKAFDHVRGRLVQVSEELSAELGSGWSVMVCEED